MIEVLRDAGLSVGLQPGNLVTLATGFQFTEGPLALADGALLFQDLKSESTYRWTSDGSVQLVREQTGAANGQTYLLDGRIVVCEQNGRRLSSVHPDGSGLLTLLETWDGKRLNSPNDVVVRSDGLVYFTDPPYGVTPEHRELDFQAVFALSLTTGAARPLATDFQKPNGLAFSPDESILYVCDTGAYHVRAFDVAADGSLSHDRVFVVLDPEQPGGPDGMKVDQYGRVYVAVAQGVWVFESDGRLLGILATPRRPSNLAWCGPGADHLAITAVDSVHRVALGTRGVLPRFQPRGG